MIRKRQILDKAKIVDQTLKLVAAKGWDNLTLESIAKAVKVPEPLFKDQFSSLSDLVCLIAAEIDREAFAILGKISGTPHDRLFDVLMARFDVLQKNRKAILNMAHTARTNRALSYALAKATLDSVYRIVDFVSIPNPSRPILASGIAAIYTWAFIAWRNDNSHDMSKTMAALDRGLRLAGKALELLKVKA